MEVSCYLLNLRKRHLCWRKVNAWKSKVLSAKLFFICPSKCLIESIISNYDPKMALKSILDEDDLWQKVLGRLTLVITVACILLIQALRDNEKPSRIHYLSFENGCSHNSTQCNRKKITTIVSSSFTTLVP